MRDILRKLPVALIALLGFITVIFSIRLDIYVAISLTILIIVCFVIFYLKYDAFIASLVFLFVVFPLNITYVIPQFVDNAYVTGTYVNYLAPTLSILDLAVVLMFLSLTVDLSLKKISKWIGVLLVFGSLYFLTHNLVHQDMNTFFSSSRYLLYFLTATLFYIERRSLLKNIEKNKGLLITVLGIVLISQFLIGTAQISRGASLGLNFLGESDVSSGGVYTSSIELDGRLFLRGYGTFPHPNILSGFASLVILVSSSLYLYFRKIDIRQFLILFVPSVLLILITFSHTGFLVTFSILSVYLSYYIFNRFVKEKEIPLNIAFVGLLTPDKSSITERRDLLVASYEYLKEYLLRGVGSGNFVKHFYQYSPSSDSGLSLMQPVHNIFMLILVEHGIIMGGLINLLVISYFIYKLIFSNSKLFVILLFLYILLIGNLDHYLLTLPQGILLFITTFLLLSITD